MHLYVAGPMAGLPEHNFPAFNAAAELLRAAGYEVTNPADLSMSCGCVPGSHTWSEYLQRDLGSMLTSGVQGLALLSGWEQSRGATLENHVAGALGWPVFTLDVWLDQPLSMRGLYDKVSPICVGVCP